MLLSLTLWSFYFDLFFPSPEPPVPLTRMHTLTVHQRGSQEEGTRQVKRSVVDLNILILDPEIPMWSILKEKIENNFRERQLSFKFFFFLTMMKKWLLKKFLVSCVSEWWFYVYNLTSLASNLFYIYLCGSESVFGIRIRIHKGPKYG